MLSDQHYWFPAKRYGWGWSFPSAWEGWIVVAVFAALLIAGAIFILPAKGVNLFIAYTVILSLALFAVCWWKGEPPHWRWGGD
jgi:hypothetical protein